ncbi:unnamed protein product [Periconia digitata]|uniref:N-acetyltransferase domain-containing protein n=1 Tax=Periconia digitata TaxID=1303443 RepID=A0A9W4U8S9_9PLEO|nr:unnamed protein product [Periconia digitata]
MAPQKRCGSSSVKDEPPAKMVKHEQMPKEHEEFKVVVKIPSEVEQSVEPQGFPEAGDSDDEFLAYPAAMGEVEVDDYDRAKKLPWFKEIRSVVQTKQPTENGGPSEVGSCVSALIQRDKIRMRFHSSIDMSTPESWTMGYALFDRYGRLKPVYKNHPFKSGSRIWGNELSTGDILLVDTLRVQREHCGKGLGQKLVKAVLDEARARTDPRTFVAIARTANMDSEVRAGFQDKGNEEGTTYSDRQELPARCLLRSLGFRRIGSSQWFALAEDPNHACHSLSANDDFDAPKMEYHTNTTMMDLFRQCRFAQGDGARLEKMQRILGSYGEEDDIWTSADAQGNNILHQAAGNESLICVEWILSKCPRLWKSRNGERETPLECCEAVHEKRRTHFWGGNLTLARSDEFAGYSEDYVKVLCLLKGMEKPQKIDLLRLKYGCTCGQCLKGILSSRMRYILQATAERERYKLDFWVCPVQLRMYLPLTVTAKLRTDRSIWRGIGALFDSFANCLRNDKLPTTKNAMEMCKASNEWVSNTRDYLGGDETIQAVGSALFELTMEYWVQGSEAFTRMCLSDDFRGLPVCRNDDEFGFVSGMCGYKRVSKQYG